MSLWIEQARARVGEVARDIPGESSVAERKKALRAAGPNFHGGTHWGRKMWARAVREYLAQHDGSRVAPLAGCGADMGRLKDRIADGDITFPFREAQS